MNLVILAAATALLALFVRGFTGFGSALLMTPILLLFLDVRTAVVAIAVTEVIAGGWIALRCRQSIDWANIKLLLPVSALGVLAGAFALVSFDNDLLRRLVGVFTVIFAIRMLLSLRRDSSHDKRWPAWTGWLAGALGGILGGAFGTGGPPVVAFLENQIRPKEILRATLLAYFLAVDALRLASYSLTGLVSRDVVQICLAMVPAALVGAFLGSKLHSAAGERSFRLGVALVLFAMGAFLAISG